MVELDEVRVDVRMPAHRGRHVVQEEGAAPADGRLATVDAAAELGRHRGELRGGRRGEVSAAETCTMQSSGTNSCALLCMATGVTVSHFG